MVKLTAVIFCFSPVCFPVLAAVECLKNCEQNVYTHISKDLEHSENIIGTVLNSELTDLPPSLIRHTSGYNYNVVEYTNNNIVHKEGNFNYIQYDDYIQISMYASFNCGDFYVPYSTPSLNPDCSPGVFSEGSELWKGTSKFAMKLRVSKKMINGSYTIDSLVAKYWMSSQNWGHDALLANYYIKGSITVPETCIIEPGEILNIDLGEVSGYDLSHSTEGSVPLNYTVKPYDINVKCSNGVNDNAKINISLIGNSAVNHPEALASSNPSVGVIVKSDNLILTPNNKNNHMRVDLINGMADFKIWPYPTKISSDIIKFGNFEANAILKFDFQ